MHHPRAETSPEKLDWGSIEGEDRAYAPKDSPRESHVPQLEHPISEKGYVKRDTNGGQKQGAFKVLLSQNGELTPAVARSEEPLKLKSVLVIPDRHNGE
jgi:hypothetical protein